MRRRESRVALVTAELWWSMEAQTLFPSSVVLATAVAQPAGLQYPWKTAVGLSGPGVTLIGAELSKARGLGSSAARWCGVLHASSVGGSSPPLVPKQHHRVAFFWIYMPCIKSDALWAQPSRAAQHGPPLDISGHRHARHHIRCHLAAVMDDCDTWAAARRTLAGR